MATSKQTAATKHPTAGSKARYPLRTRDFEANEQAEDVPQELKHHHATKKAKKHRSSGN